MFFDEQIKKLKKNNLLRNQGEYEAFENALNEIASVDDISIIKGLCSVFTDNTEDEEIMFGLIHVIERFQGKYGLVEMAKAIPDMIPTAKRWAKILHYRVLNHEPSRRLYNTVLKELDVKTRSVIIDLLNEIKKEDKELFESYINELN